MKKFSASAAGIVLVGAIHFLAKTFSASESETTSIAQVATTTVAQANSATNPLQDSHSKSSAPRPQASAASAATTLLKQEKSLLYSQNGDWSEHVAQLTEKLSAFPESELKVLGETALSSEAHGDERTLAVYLLSLAGMKARPALITIAQSALPQNINNLDPHSVEALQLEQESALRVSAITALDALAVQDPAKVQQDLEQILLKQKSSTLQSFVRISLQGIEQGRPGKLNRLQESL